MNDARVSVSFVIAEPSPFHDLALTHAGVDRSAHLRDDEQWLAQRWRDPTSRAVLIMAGYASTTAQHRPAKWALNWQPTASIPAGERYLLGVDEAERALFAVRVDELSTDLNPRTIRELAAELEPTQAGLMVHAIALANWHANHQFCSRCGAPTKVALAGAERHCVNDGAVHFPRTDPAVIVMVTDPTERALFGRQSSWPAGRFSTLAGFVEPGESAEQAVIREVAEESSVAVTDVRYLGSQPWPFPASLMLGFTARASGEPPVADGKELEEVHWFSREDFAAAIRAGEMVAPGGLSISRRLIEWWFREALPTGPSDKEWR